jgi:ketosteroid isomerase-like protein
MKITFYNLFILYFMTSFHQLTYTQTYIEKEKEALKQADIEFSILSEEKGMNFAFLRYADNNAVLLKPNSYPITGIEKIRERYSSPDTSFTLTWKPMFADVAVSLELGYTYGTWEFITIDEKGNHVSYYGTYLTIWKKNEEGKWKFVLDTGNAGLEEKK